jgi:hypothetical protein
MPQPGSLCLAVMVLAVTSGRFVAAQSAVRSTGGWQLEQTRSGMTDAPGATLALNATSTIIGPAGRPTRPTLVIRCHEGKLDTYVTVGRVLNKDISQVRLRFDGRPPVSEQWGRSSDMLGVFAPNPSAFVRGPLASADTFRIEVQPFDAAAIVVSFAPRGLRGYLPQIQAMCPRAGLDSTTIEADANVAAFIATVEQYKTTSVENKRLGVPVRWSTTVDIQRVDGKPCTLRVSRTSRGVGGGTFSTVLNLAKLSAPPVTSTWRASSGVYGKITFKLTNGSDAIEFDAPTPDAAKEIATAADRSIVACRFVR